MNKASYVPFEGPKDAKLVLVGEAPGESEEMNLRPFIGSSGKLLEECLMRHGKSRHQVYLANLSHYRPMYNKFELLTGTDQLDRDIKDLVSTIREINPNVICTLGHWPTMLLGGRRPISAHRGSILHCIMPGLEHVKVIPTYHPSYILRQRKAYPIFDQDIKRAVTDSTFRDFKYPDYDLIINPDDLELYSLVEMLCEAEYISCDIESVMNSTHILCVGFAFRHPKTKKITSVCIPYSDLTHNTIQTILASKANKIFHFGMFDNEMLWLNGFTINNWTDDTMTMQHILAPELPRSLDFITSIYTRQPYYKNTGKSEIPKDQKAWSNKKSKDALYLYNTKDCAVTLETFYCMDRDLKKDNLYDFYKYEFSLMEVAQHIGRSGLPIDQERKNLIYKGLLNKWAVNQLALNKLAGQEVNVKSPKLKTLLFDKLGLPTKRNRLGKLTTGEDAIIELIGYTKNHIEKLSRPSAVAEWQEKFVILQLILVIRGIRQLISVYLNFGTLTTVRSTYKPSSTETGRFAAEKYVDGTGFNPQTIPRDPIEIEEVAVEVPVNSSDFDEDGEDEDEDEDTLDDSGA